MNEAMFEAIKMIMGIIGAIALFLTAIEVKTDAVQNATEIAAEAIAVKQEERLYRAPVDAGGFTIFVDRETGVCYLWRKYMNAGGLTVMVDAEGKPIIWEEAENENG